MKKLKYILILSLLLVPVGFVRAANDVTLNSDVTLSLSSMDLILLNGSTFSSVQIDGDTVTFVLSEKGRIVLKSDDKYTLTNDQNSEVHCADNYSSVNFGVETPSDVTIIFTPTTTTCTGSTGTSGGGAAAGTPGGAAADEDEPPAGTQSVSKTVPGADGGSVSTSDNRAGVSIPAGLATGNISMNIVPESSSDYSSPVSNYSAAAGQVYNFSISAGGQEITDFSSPVTLTFYYTESDITGLDEDTLEVFYYDTSQKKWISVGGSVDKASNTITVEVTHFTVFGVFGEGTYLPAAESGDLIKLQCPSGADVNHICKSVYYLGSDSKRYVFPNETTYFSWYADFSDVSVVASDVMSSYSIGGNVTMRSGTYMIKITTDPKVYAVEPGGKLRWVNSEQAAQTLYGDDWIYKIVDVSDAFFVNYDASEAVDNPVADKHPIGTLIKDETGNIYYISSGNIRRLISSTGFTANNYRNEFVIDSDISYTDGALIAGAETALSTTAGP